jgi:hypothetical protein
MSFYNFNKVVLQTLKEMDENNSKIYYRYHEIDFYYKKHDDNDRLVVSFHGAKNTEPLPLFRGYNWPYNVLCISDKLLELNPNIRLAWHLSPKDTNIKEVYTEIIQNFLTKYDNVIFYGSSGGGFPALLFSSYFHKKCIIQNAQIYLEKFLYLKYTILNINPTSEFNETNGEEIIEKYGVPSMAVIMCNINDTHHYEQHYLPFFEYINKNNLGSYFQGLDFIGHEPVPPQNHHHVNIPSTMKNILECLDSVFLYNQY